MKKISFNKPYLTGEEIENINKVIKNNNLAGHGKYIEKVNKLIEEKFKTKKALVTTSCTHALEMSMLLINLQPSDEVILPSFTFSSTANSVLLRGAKPVFADIKKTTLNIDPRDIKEKITDKTKAIIPVHYAGISCDMDEIKNLANKYDLAIIEDSAQGVNSKYNGNYLGTIGDFGCYSFHETKNIISGKGGAILINEERKDLFEKAEMIWDCGTTRVKFSRGEVDKYSWSSIGSSYRLSNILASILYVQLKNMNKIHKLRENIYRKYYSELKPLEEDNKLRMPVIPDNRENNYHIFYILLKSEKDRNNLMSYLKSEGVQAVFHYIPLHSSPMGNNLDNKKEDLPITLDISKRILRLPLHLNLNETEIEYIINKIYEWFSSYKN